MAAEASAAGNGIETRPVEDLGHRVDDSISVGEDLDFQEKWWKFENAVWVFFALLLVLDLLGAFGRGVLAKAQATSDDGSLRLKYERIERTMTPSAMQVSFGPGAQQNGVYKLFVSGSLVQELGNQRIAPQPASSAIGNGGITYTFPAEGDSATVTFSLEPSAPGIYSFRMAQPNGSGIERRVVVMP